MYVASLCSGIRRGLLAGRDRRLFLRITWNPAREWVHPYAAYFDILLFFLGLLSVCSFIYSAKLNHFNIFIFTKPSPYLVYFSWFSQCQIFCLFCTVWAGKSLAPGRAVRNRVGKLTTFIILYRNQLRPYPQTFQRFNAPVCLAIVKVVGISMGGFITQAVVL